MDRVILSLEGRQLLSPSSTIGLKVGCTSELKRFGVWKLRLLVLVVGRTVEHNTGSDMTDISSDRSSGVQAASATISLVLAVFVFFPKSPLKDLVFF